MTFDRTRNYLDIETAAAGTDGRVRLNLRGELDSQSAPQLSKTVIGLLAAAPAELELRLGAVTFIDAAGVRCLLTCRQAAERAGIPLFALDARQPVHRVLEALGLLAYFGLADPEPEVPAAAAGSRRRRRIRSAVWDCPPHSFQG